MTRSAPAFFVTLALLVAQSTLFSHDGPPFPIVSDAVRGPYTISIWTDPDATDDGSPGGQFWVVIGASTPGARVPPGTRAIVSVRAAGARDTSPLQSSVAAPVRGDVTNQFGSVVMDHEGPYDVRVEIDGPLGKAVVESRVDATYDLRPPPYMLAWFLMPFLLAGFLWTRLLLRRRSVSRER